MPRTARSSTGGTGPTRRSVLVLGAAVAGLGTGAVSGCADLTGTGRAPAAGRDPDATLVNEARAALRSSLARVRRTARRHPSLQGRLAPVLALHMTHLDALDAGSARPSPSPTAPSRTPSATTTPVPSHPAAALATLTAGEHSLQAQLTGFAQRARSGELARLLGAMAAGTSQLLAGQPA